jgi:hypothetical protein
MNCATHNDVAAAAFCRTCGKPLCANCTRDVRGVIYCEACLAARMEGTAPAAGFVPPQTVYPPPGVAGVGSRIPPAPASGPHPAVAGILGAIPFGVGAVYNGQYAKGLAHLFIFVLLVMGASQRSPLDTICGIGLAFFVVYQIIDAVRTAKALQVGQPAPDPFGLGQTFNVSDKFDAGKVPTGAVVLIGLGLLFLLHTLGIMEYGFERYWPLIIILLGGWMFVRHWDRTNRTCTCGRCRTRWLMGPTMVLTTGLLLLLQSTDIAGIDRTWPAWILVVGVVKLLQSSASWHGHVGPPPPGGGTPMAPSNAVPPSAAPPTSSAAPDSTQPPSSGEVNHV